MAEGRERTKETSTTDEVSGRMGRVLCQPCLKKDKETTADVFCSSCDEFQCTECSNIHSVYAFMKGHTLVTAEEGKTKPVLFDMKGLDQCEKHRKLLEFVCRDEDMLCCSTCAIVNHRKCQSVVDIHTIGCQSRSTSSELKSKLQEIKPKAEMIVTHANSSKDRLHNDVVDIHQKISDMQDKVNKMFEDLKSSVSRDAESFESKTKAMLTKMQTSGEKYTADVTQLLETIDNVYQNGTPSQKIIADYKLKDAVNSLETKVGETCKNLETATISIQFDETLNLPPRPISEYIPGRLTLKYDVPDALRSIARADPIMKLEKIASVNLKQTGDDVEEPLYSGLDFLSDGRLVAVDNENKKCLVLNEKLEKVGSYQLSYHPQSVAAVCEDQVAVTSGGGYKIDLLRVSKSNEITLIRTCEVKTEYDSICMKDDKNFVVGTIDHPRHVRIVSMSGEEKDFSISFPNKKYPLGTSACTYLRRSEKVVVTDMDEHTVYIYDTAGNTRVAVQHDTIKQPRGVTAGHSNCLFVCSYGTHSIVQITPTGWVLSSFKLDMEYPYWVGISHDQSVLAVSNGCIGNMKLQLFRLKHT